MKSVLLVSIDNAIFDKWTKTIPESIPILMTTNKVEKKQYFMILIDLINYALDKENNAHVIFDIKITNPKNSIYLDKKNLLAINAKISNIKTDIFLSDAVIKMCFEPEDMYGTYKIVATVKDQIDGVRETLEENIELVKYEYKEYFGNDEKQFDEWFYNYHVDPSPEKAISAYFHWAPKIKKEKQTAFPPTFSFFLEIFRTNQHLIKHLLDLFDLQEEKIRFYILYLLVHLNIDVKDFFNSLKDKNLIMFQEILKTKGNFDPYLEITSGGQLDILWGTFFASGNYKPILRLLDTLKLREYYGFIEKNKEKKNFSEEEHRKILLDSIFQATMWSLTSNCSRFNLVHNYCVHYYYSENPPELNKTSLKTILIKSSDEWFKKGIANVKQEKIIEAIECFTKVVDLNPNYQRAISNLGGLFFKNKEYNKGFQYLQKALELDPNDSQALFNLGLKFAEIRDFNNAEICLKKVTDIEPDDANNWLILGHVLNDKGEKSKAIKCYKKVLELDPKNEMAKAQLAKIKK